MTIARYKKPSKRRKTIFEAMNDIHLPFFTKYTWCIIAIIGVASGFAGGCLYGMLMSQFCK